MSQNALAQPYLEAIPARARIVERLGGVAVVNEADPERNFASAFNAARYALAFR